MKTMLSKPICTLASLTLALALTISCSNDDSDEVVNNDPFADNPKYEEWKEYYKYYDPDEERCQNGVTELKCGGDSGSWYNPLKQDCYKSCSNGGGSGCSFTLGTIELCGNELYFSTDGKCQNGVLQEKCKDTWYDREKYYCDMVYNPSTGIETSTVKAKSLCGNKYYIPGNYIRCREEILEDRCGYSNANVAWYNGETHYCYNNTVRPMVRCGDKYIEPDIGERCTEGVVEKRCSNIEDVNAAWYNEITQSCYSYSNEAGKLIFTVKDKVLCQ